MVRRYAKHEQLSLPKLRGMGSVVGWRENAGVTTERILLTVFVLVSLVLGRSVLAAPPACKQEVDLKALLDAPSRADGAAASSERKDTVDTRHKFSLARSHCGPLDSPVGASSLAATNGGISGVPARQSEQLALYEKRLPTSKAPALPVKSRKGDRASSMAAALAGEQPVPSKRQRMPAIQRKVSPPKPTPPMVQRVRDLADTMAAAAAKHDVDPLLLHAMAHVESKHNSQAKSPAGALGVMQVMPNTARRFGVSDPDRSLHHAVINVDVGAAYVSTLKQRYSNDLNLVLAAYNAGEGAVDRYGLRVPPYPETRRYVKDVLDTYAVLRHNARGRRVAKVEVQR